MGEKSCEKCEYWQELEDEPAGECRRYAPHAKRRMDSARTVAAWPITHPNDWCGEFSRSPERVASSVD